MGNRLTPGWHVVASFSAIVYNDGTSMAKDNNASRMAWAEGYGDNVSMDKDNNTLSMAQAKWYNDDISMAKSTSQAWPGMRVATLLSALLRTTMCQAFPG